MNKLYAWQLKLQDNVASGLAKISGAADNAAIRMGSLQNRVSKTQSGFSSLKNIAIGAMASISLVGFVNESMKAFDAQEQANAQLKTGLKSTQAISGKTFAQLDAQATALQKITRFQDDVIMGGQSMMLTFTNVQGTIYDQSIPAVLDLASKMGGDVNSAAVQLGKALNDPLRGMNALSRVGITFSDSQQKIIENYVKTNQLSKAQQIILNEVNREMGGTAEALGNSGMGPIIRMQNTFGDVMEKLGGSASKVFFKALPLFDKLIEKISKAADWLTKNMDSIIDVIAGVYNGIRILLKYFTPLLIGIAAIEVAVWAMNAAWLLNPLVWIPVTIIGVVAAFTIMWDKMEGFRGFLMGLWDSIKYVFKSIGELAASVFGGLGDMLKGVFSGDVAQISTGFDKITGGIQKIAKMDVQKVFTVAYDKGVKQVQDKNKAKADVDYSLTASEATSGTGVTGTGATPKTDALLQQGNNSISESNKGNRTVIVNIRNLVEKMQIAVDGKNGASERDLEKRMTELLIRSIASAETSFSNGS